MIRVLLVDDHPLVVEGLRAALAQETGVEVAAVATTAAAARAALDASIDVVVCDIRLPDGSGFEFLQASRGEHPRAAFLMLSSFDTPQYVDAAMRLGAAGLLLKSSPSDTIAKTIRDIHTGTVRFASPGATTSLGRSPGLSGRERDLIRAILDGRSNDQIAADLGISRKTVEAHLSRLYARTGLETRTALALAAERGGWLDIP